MQLTPTQIPVDSRTKQLTAVVQTLFPPPQRKTEKSGLAPRDYGTPTFKTKALRIVSNVQLVKRLLLRNEWQIQHYLALLQQ